MQNFKDLKVWEKAHVFTLKVCETSKIFPREGIYTLTNQLRRAASSIPANIAEGCGKNTQLEFAHFLNIPLGSANEAEYFLILAKDLHYLSDDNFLLLTDSINEIKSDANLIDWQSKNCNQKLNLRLITYNL